MAKLKSFITLLLLTFAIGATSSLVAQSFPNTNHRNPEQTRAARPLLRQAKAVALRIKDTFQRDALLEAIGVAEANAGYLEAAIETANLTRFTPSRTLDAIGEQLAKTSDISRARALGGRLKTGGVPTILPVMTAAQIKQGKLVEALTTAALIGNAEIRSYQLEDIAMHQAAKGDYAAARITFGRARQAHPAGLVSSDELEMVIAAGQFSGGDLKVIRATIGSFKLIDQKFPLMLGGAEELWKKGSQVEAVKLLEEALKEEAGRSDHSIWRYFALSTQVRLGQRGSAMLAAGQLDSEWRVKGYMAVAVTSAETGDVAGVSEAVEKMRLATQDDHKDGVSAFRLKLMILNVTAALIDNGHDRDADHLLRTLTPPSDGVSFEMGIEPSLQLQRVLILARQNEFEAARSLALSIRPDSITDVQRGSALRITALLQTRKNGLDVTRHWALALANRKDRAHALLGIAQALLEIGDVKLGYSAIQIH